MMHRLFILKMLIFCSFLFASSCKNQIISVNKHENQAYPLISILDIKTKNTKPGTYSLKAYVTNIFICPPCPPLMGCEPCRRGNSIVVSEVNEISESYDPGEKEIIIITNKTKYFGKGKKYSFRIEILREKLPNDPNFNVINLISYKEIEN